MDRVLTHITAHLSDEVCSVDVEAVHDGLLHLPAEKYLELYKLMSEKIYSIKINPPHKNF